MRDSRPHIPTLLAGGLLAALTALAPAAGRAQPSGDNAKHWALDNGFRVATEDVPNAPGMAVTIAYPYGSERDSAGTEGLATLMAEVAFTSPTSVLPQRTREEMGEVRPLGWSIKVTPRLTMLTEVVPADRLPGLLYEISLRASDLKVTRKSLQDAVANVLDDQRQRYGGDLARTLRQGVRDAATGASAPGKPGIGRLEPQDVGDRIAAAMAPSGMVLTIVGPLGQMDVRGMVENLFGPMPGGTPPDTLAPAPLHPDSATVVVDGITRAFGILGIIAPALENPLHPEFYLHAVLYGAVCSETWGPRTPRTGAWFDFAVLDEPDMLRIYPPVAPNARTSAATALPFNTVVGSLVPTMVPEGHLENIKDNVLWLAGGPPPKEVLRRVGSTPAVVHQLSQSLAARELTGGEAFWAGYRERLARATLDLRAWRHYMLDPEHQVRVIAVPSR